MRAPPLAAAPRTAIDRDRAHGTTAAVATIAIAIASRIAHAGTRARTHATHPRPGPHARLRSHARGHARTHAHSARARTRARTRAAHLCEPPRRPESRTRAPPSKRTPRVHPKTEKKRGGKTPCAPHHTSARCRTECKKGLQMLWRAARCMMSDIAVHVLCISFSLALVWSLGVGVGAEIGVEIQYWR